MTTGEAYALPAHVQRFFTERLIGQKEASPHTVASYRDTFRLLLDYACQQLKRQPIDLLITDLDADLVSGFLAFIEDSLHFCCIASRCMPSRRSVRTNV